ncbi:GNAT family N-acetyltransferase [Paenibacillus odorifer]|uniref:GNAT family N-acetyltransferase n=1 Tax=Paenibacillus odorifer TaxID=189426 RepID=A0A1R0Y471_9BACL|nr:GNAT family N-acetyltransferase [Paenibacillus odorifer]OMD42146.1 GNAT family N-acetyltransferase [Paenibacillus odorifer]
MNILIRTATIDDTQEIARLSSELGYPLNIEQLEERIPEISNRKDHVIYVAESDRQLIGWIHASVRLLIESPPFVEIGGLVVDQQHRGVGTGKQLVEACERWAAQIGVNKLRVRTNQTREDAVRFYTRIGFSQKKAQFVLDKKI